MIFPPIKDPSKMTRPGSMLELPEVEDCSKATDPSDRLEPPILRVASADEDLRMGRPSSWIDNFTTEKSASRASPDDDQDLK